MTKKLYPTDVLEQAQSVLAAWNQIGDNLSYGDLTKVAMGTDLTQAATLASQMNALEAQLTDMRNRRDELNIALWDKVKRLRNGIKASYGDDSSQYEMVGGTRMSERKTPVRQPKTAG